MSGCIDQVLHLQPELVTVEELARLRCVSTEVKNRCCEVTQNLHAGKRAELLQFRIEFPTVDLQLIEINFSELADHCAERFVLHAVDHIRWRRNHDWSVYKLGPDPMQLIRYLLGLETRYLLEPWKHLSTEALAAMEAFDRRELIVRLLDRERPRSRSHSRGVQKISATCLLDWSGHDATLADGRCGFFHAPLKSIVTWWAARGRTIDEGGAYLYLHSFTRTFGIGTHPAKVGFAMRARSEMLALQDFAMREGTADELRRSLRELFGAERTVALQMLLLEIGERRSQPGVDYTLPAVAQAVISVFRTMVTKVATRDLAHDKRAIMRRKWMVLLCATRAGSAARACPTSSWWQLRQHIEECTDAA